MHGPAVVTWLVAALSVGAAALCTVRIRAGAGRGCTGAAGDPAGRESDTAEALMALGMAGMALLPGPVWGWLFTVLAGAMLLGVLGRAGAAGPRAHRLHHGIGALAMAYTALAMPPGAGHGHAHHLAAGAPPVTGALLVYFGAYSLWGGSRLLSAPAGGGPVAVAGAAAGSGPAVLAGGLGRACRVAMGIGMFAMLLTM
ncbi:DUF5134 domain-containing protein [Kitasatospora sp. NPDC094015]|uniref:DUF5134 domain-containing protein n=1 Tax=Kitasatospora sp. NPDC094015 TaxID=3155205 RepID=UPI00332665D4